VNAIPWYHWYYVWLWHCGSLLVTSGLKPYD